MLSDAERLQLQQLRLLEWADEKYAAPSDDVEPASAEDVDLRDRSLAQGWSLTGNLELRLWQRDAIDAWFAAGRRGTIKVVTGAGKTVVALGIAERLQREDEQLRVVIVVPTIVLLQQWYDALVRDSNLPTEAIGRLGGGHKGDFSGPIRILITVLASARKELPTLVQRAEAADHLLLVVDESHRAGAPEMSTVLTARRAYSLGLSATPERGGGEGDQTETDVLWEELGGIVYEMTFADAIRDGILPAFEIHHLGLPLNPGETQQYAKLTRSLSDTRRELTAMSGSARKAGGGEGLLAWARRAASNPSGNVSALASRYVNDTTRRKQLLYKAEARSAAALSLVNDALAGTPDARVILFHESIEAVVDLYEQMVRSGIPAVMEHSGLSADLRAVSLDLFRAGVAQVIVSARSLIEGFNVPEADLGIVVASSSSARQRIQSIGRVLRKHRDEHGEQKTSRIAVLYMHDTVDEAIYEKQDWDKLIGLDRNRYFLWDPSIDPVEQEGSPRTPIPQEAEIDLTKLVIGDRYPGRYNGAEFSTDRLGNVVDTDGRIALNPQDAPALVETLRDGPGRFRVTPNKHAILVRVPVGDAIDPERVEQLRLLADTQGEQLPLGRTDEWVTLFGGVLRDGFRFPSAEESSGPVDVVALSPGDRYDGSLEPTTWLRFRQRGGGVVAKKIRGGEAFAHGPEADRLVAILHDVAKRGNPVTRFYVNSSGHAFWREQGEGRFLMALDGELDFPREAAGPARASS